MSDGNSNSWGSPQPITPTAYQLVVNVGDQRITFDALVRGGDAYDETSRYFVISPGKVQHRAALGCVVLAFSTDPAEDSVMVQTVIHDPACTPAGQLPLARKTGTRAMLLGALHAMRALAREEYPHLLRVELSDESTFPCPPLSRAVHTFATDVLLQGTTYYQRHLGMAPARGIVKSTLRAAAERMRSPVEDGFNAWWAQLSADGLGQTDEQRAWLSANEDGVRAIFFRVGRGTWGALFRELHAQYDCTFFAACAMQLVNMFHLTPLLGALWQVDMDALPDTVDGASITASLSQQTMEGGSVSSARATRRLQRMFALAQRACFLQHSTAADCRINTFGGCSYT